MTQVKNNLSITAFDARQLFDFNKIEEIAMTFQLEDWKAMFNRFYSAYTRYYIDQPTNYMPLLPEGQLLKKQLKEIMKCIPKKLKKDFDRLGQQEQSFVIMTLLENIYLTGMGQNNLFIQRYEKYIKYREQLMIQASQYLNPMPNMYLHGNVGVYFKKTYKTNGLYSIRFKTLEKEIYPDKDKAKYLYDFRHGVIYNHYIGVPSRSLMENPITAAQYIAAQSKMLNTIYFQTHNDMIDKMIEDGISEEEARKAFPRP